MKHPVIALKKHSGEVKIMGERTRMILPPGCIGICFVFETKKAARKYWGNDIEMIRIERVDVGLERD